MITSIFLDSLENTVDGDLDSSQRQIVQTQVVNFSGIKFSYMFKN